MKVEHRPTTLDDGRKRCACGQEFDELPAHIEHVLAIVRDHPDKPGL